VVAASLVLAYGLEIFGNQTSVDEPVLGVMGRWAMLKFWVGAGRWSMGITNILVATPVVPVVSTALGVALLGVALWWIAEQVHLFGWERVAIVSVGATMPVLTYHFLFNTNALGLGVGLLCVAATLHLVRKGGWPSLLAAIATATYAVGTYDSFIVCLAMLPALAALASPDRLTWLRAGGVAVGAVVLSRVIAGVFRVVLGIPDARYVDKFFDPAGLIRDPLHRTVDAVGQVVDALSLPLPLFGRTAPWLALWVFLAVLGAGFHVVSGPHRVSRAGAAFLFLALPVAAHAVVPVVPPASMIYLPFSVLGLSTLAVRGWTGVLQGRLRFGTFASLAAAGLAVLTVLNNAVLAENVQAGQAITVMRDRDVALRINDELLTAVPTATLANPVPVVISAPVEWPAGPWQVAIDSLYMGARWAGPDYLITLGIPATDPTQEQWVAGIKKADSMPRYPSVGWAQYADGVLVVNLGPVPPQFRDRGPDGTN